MPSFSFTTSHARLELVSTDFTALLLVVRSFLAAKIAHTALVHGVTLQQTGGWQWGRGWYQQ